MKKDKKQTAKFQNRKVAKIAVPDPPVETQSPPMRVPGVPVPISDVPMRTLEPSVEVRDHRLWPNGDKMPEVYIKRRPLPCPACRRVMTDEHGRAVVTVSIASDVAWLRCKCCDHRWGLPVREA